MPKLKRAFIITCSLSFITCYLLTAQVRSEAYSLSRAHIIISQEAGQLIDAGLTAQQQNNWPAALKNYQQAMELYPNYTVPIQGRTIYKGVKFLCRELISHMPEEGYQMYQTLFGPAAKPIFELGIRQRRMNLLAQITEQYPFSSYGLNALLLLGYDAWETGEHYQAQLLFKEALDLPYLSAEVQSGLKQLISFSSRKRVRDSSETTSPLARDKNLLPPTHWRTYGGNNYHNQLMSPSLQTLPPHTWYFKFPSPATQPPRLIPGWRGPQPRTSIEYKYYRPYFPCFSGSLHSSQTNNMIYLNTDNAVYAFNLIQTNTPEQQPTPEATPPAPIVQPAKPVWKFELPFPAQGIIPFEERKIHPCTLLNFETDSIRGKPQRSILYANLITSIGESERRLGYLEVKPGLPKRALFAFDAQTGKILWTLGGDNSAHDFLKRANFPMPPASTGNNLYTIAIYAEHQTDLPEHYLVCLDPHNGKIKWRTFIASGLLETNLFNNPTRESIGSTLTLNENSVFYCSHMGIVTALDQRTGLIKWIRKYHQYDITPTTAVTPIRLPWHWINNPLIYVPGSAEQTPLPLPALLVTPVDSPYLYALNPLTGEELWKWDGTELGRVRYLIGVKDNLLFLSGEQTLVCLNMAQQGKREWLYHRVGPEILVGKPGLTTDILYLPTTTGIKLLNNRTGKLVNTWSQVRPPISSGQPPPAAKGKPRQRREGSVSEGLNNPEGEAGPPAGEAGNVFLWDNILVISSQNQLTVYYDRTKLDNWLLQELNQRPDDPYLLKQAGEICRRTGNYEKAIRYFKQAYQIVSPVRSNPESIRDATAPATGWTSNGGSADPMQSSLAHTLKAALYKTHLDLGLNIVRETRRPEEKLRYLEKARQWAPEPNMFINATAHLIEYYQTQTPIDTTKLVALHQNLLENYPESASPQSGIRVWDWAKMKIDKLIQQHGRITYALEETKANKLWQQLAPPKLTPLQTGDSFILLEEAILKLFTRYPNSEIAERKLYELCLELETNQHYSKVQSTANLFITYFPKSKDIGRIYTILVQHHEREGKYLLAKKILRLMHQKSPDDKITLPSGQRITIRNYVEKKLSTKEYQLVPYVYRKPVLTIPLKSGWQWINRDTNHIQPLVPDFVDSKNRFNMVLAITGNEMQLLDKSTGRLRWKKQVPTELKPHFIVSDDKVILMGKTELLALRLKPIQPDKPAGEIIWRYPLNINSAKNAYFVNWAVDFTGQRIFALVRNLVDPDRIRIVALDTSTGKELWLYQGHGQIVSNLLTSETYVIVPTTQHGIVLLEQESGQVTRLIKTDQPIISALYIPASLTNSLAPTNEYLCILSQGASNKIKVYALAKGQITNQFVVESTEPRGETEIVPDSFSTNNQKLICLSTPKRTSPLPSFQIVIFEPATGKKVFSAQINDYIKYVVSDLNYTYLVARLKTERNKLSITAYKKTTQSRLSSQWSCPIDLTETTSFSQVLLTEQHILLNCSTYDRNRKKWTPLVYIINKKDGTIAQKIIGELKSQGQPEVVVTDGILMLVQDNRITGYVGQ